MSNPEAEKISEIKDTVTQVLPIPPQQQLPVSSARALKDRLDWGEPALTILDARDSEAYLEEHIVGAMSIASDDLVERFVNSLAKNREIYVYGDNETQADAAAEKFRTEGFTNVSQLQGGLAGWKAISGATEGRVA
ncbi:MAG: rhodanese-like domain-containing protein [Xenococcaceae cyanobacterium MO_188.B32]|nr:rhodanese-like domain-containing protein [Xenococcaceae cyanobacterium MO_188.B32]